MATEPRSQDWLDHASALTSSQPRSTAVPTVGGTPASRWACGPMVWSTASTSPDAPAPSWRRQYAPSSAPATGGLYRWTQADTTLGGWVEHWLTAILPMTARWKTRSTYTSQLRLHILPSLAPLRSSEIQPENLEGLYADLLREGSSAHTVGAVHRVLRSCLNEAVRRAAPRRGGHRFGFCDRFHESPLIGRRRRNGRHDCLVLHLRVHGGRVVRPPDGETPVGATLVASSVSLDPAMGVPRGIRLQLDSVDDVAFLAIRSSLLDGARRGPGRWRPDHADRPAGPLSASRRSWLFYG